VTFCSDVSIIARKNFTLWESFFDPLKALVSKGLYIILLAHLPPAKVRHKIFKKD